jgi:hypothetical protein
MGIVKWQKSKSLPGFFTIQTCFHALELVSKPCQNWQGEMLLMSVIGMSVFLAMVN